MEEIRNLGKEAAQMAIRQFATINPGLSLAATRKKLRPEVKEQIFMMLLMLAEQYEAQLIAEISYGRQK